MRLQCHDPCAFWWREDGITWSTADSGSRKELRWFRGWRSRLPAPLEIPRRISVGRTGWPDSRLPPLPASCGHGRKRSTARSASSRGLSSSQMPAASPPPRKFAAPAPRSSPGLSVFPSSSRMSDLLVCMVLIGRGLREVGFQGLMARGLMQSRVSPQKSSRKDP